MIVIGDLLLGISRHFIIAYSGGLDSHVLLHLLSELRKKNSDITVTAVHVNHQLNPLSDYWAQHCEKICLAFNIPIIIEKIHIDLKAGDSVEENARHARYAILEKYINKNNVLLTAHNLNDQAETFLLQALRGAGSKGLSAMPVKKKLDSGVLIRPLLHYSRDALEKYATENNLKWIEDDSNADTKFNRNYLRHAVFPILKKRFPAVMQNFSRCTRIVAEQEKIIADIAKADLALCCDASTCNRTILHIKPLLALCESRQRLVLREWFRENNLRMPNEKHLKEIQKTVLHAAPDAHPVFRLGNTIVMRERNILKIDFDYLL